MPTSLFVTLFWCTSVDLVIAQLVVSLFSEVREKPCPDQTVAVSCTTSGRISWAYNDQPLFSFDADSNAPLKSASGEISSGIVSFDGSERTSILSSVGFRNTSFSALCNSRRIQVMFSDPPAGLVAVDASYFEIKYGYLLFNVSITPANDQENVTFRIEIGDTYAMFSLHASLVITIPKEFVSNDDPTVKVTALNSCEQESNSFTTTATRIITATAPEELTVTLKSEVFSSGAASFNCSLSNYNGQVEVLSFQIGDEVLSCKVDPDVPCSFQDNVTGIQVTNFNPITNSILVTTENVTFHNGSSAVCSVLVANSTVIKSNRINILVLGQDIETAATSSVQPGYIAYLVTSIIINIITIIIVLIYCFISHHPNTKSGPSTVKNAWTTDTRFSTGTGAGISAGTGAETSAGTGAETSAGTGVGTSVT